MCVNLQPEFRNLVRLMRRFIYTLCLMGLVSLGFQSCLGSSDSTPDLYDETCINSMAITAVNRLEHTIGSDWQDSTYKVKVTKFPTLTIDQKNYEIYNTDSLPFETDMEHILVSIGKTDYSGAIVLKSIGDEDLYKLYSSTDSIDFSDIREIRVLNTDGSKYRAYKVHLVAHQAPTNKILWEDKSEDSYPAKKSDDEGVNWDEVVKEAGLAKFIGAGIVEAYAFRADGQIMVTTDKGKTWQEDLMDDDRSLAPIENFKFISTSFVANYDADYQLLVGTASDDLSGQPCRVWRKIAEYAKGSMPSKWVYMPLEDYNPYYLPNDENYSLIHFNDEIMAVSKTGIRVTRDGGITWKTDSRYQLRWDNYEDIVATTDDQGHIWVKEIETGLVCCGTYNKE